MKTRGELIVEAKKWWDSLDKEQKADLVFHYDRNKSYQLVDVIDIVLIYMQLR